MAQLEKTGSASAGGGLDRLGTGSRRRSGREVRRLRLAGVGWLAAAVAGSVTLALAQLPEDELTREQLEFTRIYGLVEENYAEALSPDRIILDGAVRHMLATLDPFSAFFDRDQFAALQEQARGQALGFGSILYVQPGKVLVLQTTQGSPSWRAGLGPGDEIVAINGERVSRLDFQSLVALLQRSRSRPVRLAVIHPGQVVPHDFELKPAEVALPTVDKSFLLQPGIGYIHISGFESKTRDEVVRALKDLGASKQPHGRGGELKGLLLDLRDNHGGMVDAALGVVSLFLKPNQPVLSVRGRASTGGPQTKVYQALPSPLHFDGPLVVLVDGDTASAAEVVTAALQDHDRALIVGEPTFGKGVVETVMGLSEGTGLALTTAEYFAPSGRSIQKPLPGTALASRAMAEDGTAAHPASGLSAAAKLADVGLATRDAAHSSSNASSKAFGAAFHTDNGRPVSAGGGVTPDVLIPALQLDPWVSFLNQRGAFTDFASEYLTLHRKVPKDFEPDSGTLADFKDFLTRQGIRAPDKYWNKDQAYLKLRIKVETLNLVYGLTWGEEVATQNDPQVQRAVRLFAQLPQLLQPVH
jgi:carboxyl-terminal processing protease